MFDIADLKALDIVLNGIVGEMGGKMGEYGDALIGLDKVIYWEFWEEPGLITC
jgi:hypothetical protein